VSVKTVNNRDPYLPREGANPHHIPFASLVRTTTTPSSASVYGPVLRKRLQLEASRRPFFSSHILYRMPACMLLSRYRQRSDLPTRTLSCKTCIYFYLYPILILAHIRMHPEFPALVVTGLGHCVLGPLGIWHLFLDMRSSTLTTVVSASVSI
jgi:hypothetical protein